MKTTLFISPKFKKRKLSLQEQQLYFKEIVEACVGMDDKRRFVTILRYADVSESAPQRALPTLSCWCAGGVP